MSPYPLLDDLELHVRAGRGAAVIVEGESAEEDAGSTVNGSGTVRGR